jgi:hypothetical protein
MGNFLRIMDQCRFGAIKLGYAIVWVPDLNSILSQKFRFVIGANFGIRADVSGSADLRGLRENSLRDTRMN